MKHIFIIFVLTLALQIPAFSQGVMNFNVNFGGNPPPHTPGDPDSGAILTNNSFYAILYLDTTVPVSGSIEELDGGIYTTVFQFNNLVFASYPGGGPAYDYEGSWQLTDNQVQNLLAGKWYAQVTYSDTSYIGQITAVPEPSSFTLLLVGLIAIPVFLRRRMVISNTALEPTPTVP